MIGVKMSGLTIIATVIAIGVTACFIGTKIYAQGIRVIVEDHDAILKPITNSIAGAKAVAKAERKLYQGGDQRLSLKCRKMALPRGAEIEFYINGKKIGMTDVNQGSANFELKSEAGDDVPGVADGDLAEVRYKSELIMEGKFHKD